MSWQQLTHLLHTLPGSAGSRKGPDRGGQLLGSHHAAGLRWVLWRAVCALAADTAYDHSAGDGPGAAAATSLPERDLHAPGGLLQPFQLPPAPLRTPQAWGLPSTQLAQGESRETDTDVQLLQTCPGLRGGGVERSRCLQALQGALAGAAPGMDCWEVGTALRLLAWLATHGSADTWANTHVLVGSCEDIATEREVAGSSSGSGGQGSRGWNAGAADSVGTGSGGADGGARASLVDAAVASLAEALLGAAPASVLAAADGSGDVCTLLRALPAVHRCCVAAAAVRQAPSGGLHTGPAVTPPTHAILRAAMYRHVERVGAVQGFAPGVSVQELCDCAAAAAACGFVPPATWLEVLWGELRGQMYLLSGAQAAVVLDALSYIAELASAGGSGAAAAAATPQGADAGQAGGVFGVRAVAGGDAGPGEVLSAELREELRAEAASRAAVADAGQCTELLSELLSYVEAGLVLPYSVSTGGTSAAAAGGAHGEAAGAVPTGVQQLVFGVVRRLGAVVGSCSNQQLATALPAAARLLGSTMPCAAGTSPAAATGVGGPVQDAPSSTGESAGATAAAASAKAGQLLPAAAAAVMASARAGRLTWVQLAACVVALASLSGVSTTAGSIRATGPSAAPTDLRSSAGAAPLTHGTIDHLHAAVLRCFPHTGHRPHAADPSTAPKDSAPSQPTPTTSVDSLAWLPVVECTLAELREAAGHRPLQQPYAGPASDAAAGAPQGLMLRVMSGLLDAAEGGRLQQQELVYLLAAAAAAGASGQRVGQGQRTGQGQLGLAGVVGEMDLPVTGGSRTLAFPAGAVVRLLACLLRASSPSDGGERGDVRNVATGARGEGALRLSSSVRRAVEEAVQQLSGAEVVDVLQAAAQQWRQDSSGPVPVVGQGGGAGEQDAHGDTWRAGGRRLQDDPWVGVVAGACWERLLLLAGLQDGAWDQVHVADARQQQQQLGAIASAAQLAAFQPLPASQWGVALDALAALAPALSPRVLRPSKLSSLLHALVPVWPQLAPSEAAAAAAALATLHTSLGAPGPTRGIAPAPGTRKEIDPWDQGPSSAAPAWAAMYDGVAHAMSYMTADELAAAVKVAGQVAAAAGPLPSKGWREALTGALVTAPVAVKPLAGGLGVVAEPSVVLSMLEGCVEVEVAALATGRAREDGDDGCSLPVVELMGRLGELLLLHQQEQQQGEGPAAQQQRQLAGAGGLRHVETRRCSAQGPTVDCSRLCRLLPPLAALPSEPTHAAAMAAAVVPLLSYLQHAAFHGASLADLVALLQGVGRLWLQPQGEWVEALCAATMRCLREQPREAVQERGEGGAEETRGAGGPGLEELAAVCYAMAQAWVVPTAQWHAEVCEMTMEGMQQLGLQQVQVQVRGRRAAERAVEQLLWAQAMWQQLSREAVAAKRAPGADGAVGHQGQGGGAQEAVAEVVTAVLRPSEEWLTAAVGACTPLLAGASPQALSGVTYALCVLAHDPGGPWQARVRMLTAAS